MNQLNSSYKSNGSGYLIPTRQCEDDLFNDSNDDPGYVNDIEMNSIGKNSTRTYSYDDEGDYETPYADETYTEYNFGAKHDNLSKHKNLKSADENSKFMKPKFRITEKKTLDAWIIIVIVILVILSVALGLSIYFIPKRHMDVEQTEKSIQKAVLILSTREALNKPILVDLNGNENKQLNFDYDERVTVYGGCGTSLFGVFWYFGGRYSNDKRQASKIDGCKLVRQNDLLFDFDGGSCNSFDFPEPRILLCFDFKKNKQCHTFNGDDFWYAEMSKYSHRWTFGLANYRGKALTTGCYDDSSCSVKTEIMDMKKLEWSDAADFPYPKEISCYSTAATSSAAYIIGGSYTRNIVAEFRENQWHLLGSLLHGRSHHASIAVGKYILIIGGWESNRSLIETEVWNFDEEHHTTISPTLPNKDFTWGIGLFVVNFTFCENNVMNQKMEAKDANVTTNS